MPGLSDLALAPLGFLALATCGGAFVELAAAGLREDPGLLDLLVETAKGGLERLAIANDHFRQWSMDHPPFGLMRLVAREQNAGPLAGPTGVMIAARWHPRTR
jgi:hypothetical protein